MIKIGEKTIFIKQGDITKEETDAIVNPANGFMIHKGGAALTIATRAGDLLQEHSRKIIEKSGQIPSGKGIITLGYNLPCKFVIHVVGPKMGEGQEDEKLMKSVNTALNLADMYNLKSISMPAISSGIFGYPKDKCAQVLLETTIQYLKDNHTSIERVIMCNYDKKTYNVFLQKERAILI
ncbi:macro domain-containing protein [Clostridium niameyense]|uniref:macro domain-containing protein n=1 Tax=Clostridium niameyense TaxID=1622073 RepID=UPI00067F10CF|nr:macro domain-containing protein [Clostridium niameyense]